MDYRVDYYDEVNSIIVNYSEMVGKPFVIRFFVNVFGPDRAQRSIAFLSF